MADRQGFYFQGEEKLRDWLRKVELKAGDHKALYDELGDILLDGVHDRFKRGVAPDGRPWQKRPGGARVVPLQPCQPDLCLPAADAKANPA